MSTTDNFICYLKVMNSNIVINKVGFIKCFNTMYNILKFHKILFILSSHEKMKVNKLTIR